MIKIEELLDIAKANGASDVHITVGIPPRMRISGELISMDFASFEPSETFDLLESMMERDQIKRFELYGEVDFAYSIPKQGRYRINAFKQRGSVAIVLRLVDNVIPELESMGIPDEVVDLCKKKSGLILISGPAGAGTTTTLASFIHKMNMNRSAHIITLEDPIEYLHNHEKSIVHQREIGLDSYSFANAIHEALREDPDVICVGEMKELDTISTAVTAAENGYLVFSTLHTVGIVKTIERLIEVFPTEQKKQMRLQLANVLEAVISQQLVPRANGEGRVAAFEVMFATDEIRDLIRKDKIVQIYDKIKNDKYSSMITMDKALHQLYMEGVISRDTAINYTFDTFDNN